MNFIEVNTIPYVFAIIFFVVAALSAILSAIRWIPLLAAGLGMIMLTVATIVIKQPIFLTIAYAAIATLAFVKAYSSYRSSKVASK